jgi:hypothetical protein
MFSFNHVILFSMCIGILGIEEEITSELEPMVIIAGKL